MGTSKKEQQQSLFLVSLQERGVVAYACKATGISRRTVYNWRRDDPDFAAAWVEAEQDAIDALEAEAYRRAKIGTKKPVFQQGRQVGFIREYSDVLLIFLLKAKRPNEFRDSGTANYPTATPSTGGGLVVSFTPSSQASATHVVTVTSGGGS